jgi:hypothetical protein
MNPQSAIDLPTFEALKEAMGAGFINELVQAYFDETPQLLAKLQRIPSNRPVTALELSGSEHWRRNWK